MTSWEVEEEELCGSPFRSSHECPCCQESLMYTDEMFLVEVVEAVQENGQILWQPLTCLDGDYQFPPYTLHLDCWEEVLEQIRENTEDRLPMECENGILFCTTCASTISAFEPFVAASFGEVRVSRRCPDGRTTESIAKLAGMKPVCLACIVYVVEDHFEDWEDLFENLPSEEEEEDEC